MERYIIWFRRLLPSPFSIALVLTIVSLIGVLGFNVSQTGTFQFTQTIRWWSNGLWTPSLMVFAMQMMLMLVLGHVLALSSGIRRLINVVVQFCIDSSRAAWVICTLTIIVGLFNWGLGLIFGAILAKRVAYHFTLENKPFNYPLLAAAGYSALMVWHGGLSGSALIKAAEPNAIHEMMKGIMEPQNLASLPAQIPITSTVFSARNLTVSLMVLLVLPLVLAYIGKKIPGKQVDTDTGTHSNTISSEPAIGAEHIDRSPMAGILVGGGIIAYCIYLLVRGGGSFFTPNNINLTLLGLCLFSHQRINSFLSAIEYAIRDASGILIQFPLYFGIMGLINESGLITAIAESFTAISNEFTYPLFTYISAGIVNIFVPSGGGQWVVQGPIILLSAYELNVPIEKAILALAYGDQITNMLQPFWALPLLGITRLSARDILPYTLIMFSVGFVIYLAGLALF